MFTSIQRINFIQHSKHYQDYLFLNTIYRQVKEVVLYQMVLSSLGKDFFFLLHTKDISQDKHLLFFQEAQYHKQATNEYKDP